MDQRLVRGPAVLITSDLTLLVIAVVASRSTVAQRDRSG